jgi:hypothetical protein
MNWKLVSMLPIFLTGYAPRQGSNPITHKEYIVCGKSVKEGPGYSIRIEKQFVKGDTIYSRLYFPEESKFSLLKIFHDKYLIESNFDLGGQPKFQEFFNLNSKIGTETNLEWIFLRSESALVLKSKRYSKTLKDTLIYFSISGSECAAQGDCVSEIVVSRSLGFVRLKFEPKNGCVAYFFLNSLAKKRRKSDDALSELVFPISGHY